MDRLRAALAASAEGRGQTVVILGEAGVGKTRLVEALMAGAQESGHRVVVGRCFEAEQILPFGPWAEALRAALPANGPAVALEPRVGQELSRLLPERFEPAASAMGPPDDFLRLFEAVAALVRVVAAPRPLVVVLEDLHWGDEMTARLLAFLARRIGDASILLVATAREEDLPDVPVLRRLLDHLHGSPDVTALALSPLTERDTRRLVETLARAGTHEAALGRIADQVWAVSEGNPFVVVEAMRALVDGQQLGRAETAVPERVRQLIADRLDRLGHRARDLVSVAAVVGREFEFALLERAAGLSEEDAAEGLEELVRRRLLRVVGERIDFVHDRIREAAYARLLPPRRKLLHAAVGDAIAAVYAADVQPHHAALGLHYRRGGAWDDAVTHLWSAGALAMACSAHRDAASYFEEALEALAHLPDGRPKTELAFDIRMYFQAAVWSLGELPRIIERLGEAEPLARALGDKRRLAQVSGILAACLTTLGDLGRADTEARRALAIAEELGEFALEILATLFLGLAATGMGDYARAAELLARSAARLQGEKRWKRLGQPGLPSVFALAWRTLPLSELGRFEEAIASGAEALEIAEKADHPYSMALASWALGNAYCVQEQVGPATPLLERSAELCRAHELVVLSPLSSSLGRAYALAGRHAEALPLLEGAVTGAASLGFMWLQGRRLVHLGEAHRLRGRVREARAAAERALRVAEAQGERGQVAHALHLRGQTRSRRTARDRAAAESDLSRALALAKDMGMRPLVARCRQEIERVRG
jgi:tetratricopeptide (TPR) repeat protein